MSTKTQVRSVRHQQAHAGNGEMKKRLAEKPALVAPTINEEERCCLIRVRAYDLWEQAGKPDGHAVSQRFWCEAEQEVMASHATHE